MRHNGNVDIKLDILDVSMSTRHWQDTWRNVAALGQKHKWVRATCLAASAATLRRDRGINRTKDGVSSKVKHRSVSGAGVRQSDGDRFRPQRALGIGRELLSEGLVMNTERAIGVLTTPSSGLHVGVGAVSVGLYLYRARGRLYVIGRDINYGVDIKLDNLDVSRSTKHRQNTRRNVAALGQKHK